MLYIIRHGKTDWNAAHRLQGTTDTHLNEEGREMARNAAKRYADINFDVCYCSPLARARETAELLLEGRSIPIIVDDRLKEMCFGEYEGECDCLTHPDWNIYHFFKDPENYVPDKGAESLEHLYERTGNFCDEIVEPLLKAGKDVLIVGHGAMNSSIVARYQNNKVSEFWRNGIPNCELFKLV